MPIKYIPYYPDTVEGQALLSNFVRTHRALKYRDNEKVYDRIKKGMPYYEVETVESIGNNPKNMAIRGECLSACAYLKEQNIKVDLVYIDPPFASGADYAKKIYIRRNPKVAEAMKKAEEKMEIEELQAFEEKMYGDIWSKEAYLNWIYENLTAIKSIMSNTASIYVHLDTKIGHYVKVIMDEVFGEDKFINEIIWHYDDKFATGGKSMDKNHDTIFLYAKESDYVFNPIIIPKGKTTKRALRKKVEGKTVNVLDESGNKIYVEYDEKKADDVWQIGRTISKNEYLNYATQKPEKLLERIINASSNNEMIVADFFGGSGVTAKVANDLGRNFIHCDVGINSIQTTRDRLVEAGSKFDVLEIKDGVNLFRNPAQTMDKLAKLIPGLQQKVKGLSKFWFGAISDSKLGTIPVYIPDLKDSNQKVLDIPIINRIVNQEIPALENVQKVVVYYIDMDDENVIVKFIKDNNMTEITIELRDLKQLLSETVVDDYAECKLTESKGIHTIEFTQFTSDHLRQKIDEYNQKRQLQPLIGEDDEEEEKPKKKKNKFFPIEISKEGLELIEFISLDCTNKDGIWQSEKEIKIDKLGYVIEDGSKTKNFWDAKISSKKKPLRVKIRNIAGDEVVSVLK